MSTTPTPGPWEVIKHHHVDDELWLSVNQHADAAGMKEWIAEIKYLTTEPERQWANARLIAAAPDLLAALKCADAAINPPDVGGISLHEWNQRLKAATATVRAVLARADASQEAQR